MSDFNQARLLYARCELERAVTERESMVAANKARELEGLALQYTEFDFLRLANRMADNAPDVHQFS